MKCIALFHIGYKAARPIYASATYCKRPELIISSISSWCINWSIYTKECMHTNSALVKKISYRDIAQHVLLYQT